MYPIGFFEVMLLCNGLECFVWLNRIGRKEKSFSGVKKYFVFLLDDCLVEKFVVNLSCYRFCLLFEQILVKYHSCS